MQSWSCSPPSSCCNMYSINTSSWEGKGRKREPGSNFPLAFFSEASEGWLFFFVFCFLIIILFYTCNLNKISLALVGAVHVALLAMGVGKCCHYDVLQVGDALYWGWVTKAEGNLLPTSGQGDSPQLHLCQGAPAPTKVISSRGEGPIRMTGVTHSLSQILHHLQQENSHILKYRKERDQHERQGAVQK